MVTVEPIDRRNAGAFAHLATGFGVGRLNGSLDGLVGVGARTEQRPVGLFLARLDDKSPRTGQVLTLRVAERWRRGGIGTQLLEAGEDASRTAGCVAITGPLAESAPDGPAASMLATRAGWTRLRHVRTFYKVAHRAVGQVPWVTHGRRWPQGFEVLPWRACGAREREQLLERRLDPRFFDPYLDPFDQESDHTGNSVGLLRCGEIVGWAVSRHLYPANPGHGVMSWTRLFVRPDLQRRGYGAMLLAEHIKAGPAAGITHAVFSVEPENWFMRRLIEKRLAAALSGVREIWEMGKALTPEGAARLA